MSAGIAAALVAAQAELTNPKKTSKANTGTYSYTYADLASILDHIRPVLGKHGLAVTQNVSMEEGRLEVFTTLHHASGEFLTFGPITGTSGGNWQALGSAVTYARRYALTAALGLAGEEDDDAQAVTATPQVQRVKAAPVAVAEEVLGAQVIEEDPWQTPAVTADGMDNGRALPEYTRTPDRSQMHNVKATEAQLKWVKRDMTTWGAELGQDPLELLNAWLVDHAWPPVDSFEGLGKGAASAVITALKERKA